MIIFYLSFPFYNFISAPYFCRGKRLIKFHHEVISKIIRYSPAIFSRIAGYRAIFLIYLNKRPVIECIYYDIRLFTFWESKPKISRTFRWSKFCFHIMVSQIHTIIIRLCSLSFMRKPASSFILQELFTTGHRHQCKLPIIIDPRTGLMCLLKSFYLVVGITIGPTISHISRLRCPEIHSPR